MLLQVLGQRNGRFDIFLLRRFVTSGQQNNDHSTAIGVVDPVPRAEIDLEFANAVGQRSMLAWIAIYQAIHTDLDSRASSPILERVDPVSIDLCDLYAPDLIFFFFIYI